MSVAEILMYRDGISQKEAIKKVKEVREMLADADPWEAEYIIADELGLELDYIFELI